MVMYGNLSFLVFKKFGTMPKSIAIIIFGIHRSICEMQVEKSYRFEQHIESQIPR